LLDRDFSGCLHDAGDDRGHGLVRSFGLERRDFRPGEQHLTGPDRREIERVHVGIRGDPGRLVELGCEQHL